MDGELMNAQHPETFEIPPRLDREMVRIGDFVKLGFIYPKVTDEEQTMGERMWVKVTAYSGLLFTGTIANTPFEAELNYGDEVKFMPQHVLDVLEKGDVD